MKKLLLVALSAANATATLALAMDDASAAARRGGVNRASVNAGGVNRGGVNRAGVNRVGVNRVGIDRVGVNGVGIDRVGVNRAGIGYRPGLAAIASAGMTIGITVIARIGSGCAGLASRRLPRRRPTPTAATIVAITPRAPSTTAAILRLLLRACL